MYISKYKNYEMENGVTRVPNPQPPTALQIPPTSLQFFFSFLIHFSTPSFLLFFFFRSLLTPFVLHLSRLPSFRSQPPPPPPHSITILNHRRTISINPFCKLRSKSNRILYIRARARPRTRTHTQTQTAHSYIYT